MVDAEKDGGNIGWEDGVDKEKRICLIWVMAAVEGESKREGKKAGV